MSTEPVPPTSSSNNANPQASTTGNLAPGLVMVTAACNALNAQSNMQISDAQMVEVDTDMENTVMSYQDGPSGPMATDTTNLTNSVNEYNSCVDNNDTSGANQAQANITEEQTQFQQDNTNASNIEQMYTSLTQSAENQVSQDSSNEQQNVQTSESAIQLMSSLANLLSKPL